MRTKTALINLVFNLLQQLVNIVTSLVVPVLFIHTYGSVINGLNASVKQITSYLNIIEAGVAMSSTQSLYKPIFDKDIGRINCIISATNKFYLRSGLMLSILIATLASSLPWIINDNVPKFVIFFIVLILGTTGIVEYFVTGKYVVLLIAAQKSYVVSIGQIIGYTLSTIASVVFIWFGQGFLIVQLIATSSYVVFRVGTLMFFVRKYFPYVRFNVTPDVKAISNRWDAMVHQITGLVVTNTPFVLLTIFGTLKDVSIYSIYFLVFGGVSVIVTTFSNGLAAAFGEVMVQKDQISLNRGFKDYEYVYYIFLTVIYASTTILINPFISLYTSRFSDANYVNLSIALQFVFIGISNNIRVPSMTLVIAAGHFKETRLRAVLEATINIIASLIFTQFWGMSGVLMGSICSFTYRTVDFVFYCNRFILRQSPKESIIRIARNLFLGSFVAIPLVFSYPIHIKSWFEWILYAGCVSVIVLLVVISGNMLLEFSQMKRSADRFLFLVKGARRKYYSLSN